MPGKNRKAMPEASGPLEATLFPSKAVRPLEWTAVTFMFMVRSIPALAGKVHAAHRFLDARTTGLRLV